MGELRVSGPESASSRRVIEVQYDVSCGDTEHPARAERIKQILDALDAASPLEDLSEPTYRLHPLKGNRQGQWSVRVDRTWRIVFRAKGEDVFDVDLIDYH